VRKVIDTDNDLDNVLYESLPSTFCGLDMTEDELGCKGQPASDAGNE
jgi:hypothetical protein